MAFNTDTFLDSFGHLADAPNGIQKLRELVLQLAVQGKLVPQDTNDEPADVLLERIREEKERLVKAGRIKKDRPSSPPAMEYIVASLPDGWVETSLGSISIKIHYGYTASADATIRDVRLLRITDIQNNMVDWDRVPGCVIGEDKTQDLELRDGDLLIARTGGTIGKSYLVENLLKRAVFASYLIRVVPCPPAFPRYIKVFLESPLYWVQLHEKSMGTGQPNVNATSLKGLRLPLPPLAEQKRIVAKVDELMALIDDLEARQEERKQVRIRLNAASLHRLTTADTPKTVALHWQPIKDHFDLLYNTPDTVPALRQAILQLAVQGKLLGRSATLAITDCTVGDFVKIQNGYAFKSTWFEQRGIRLVRNANVGHGTLRWTDVARVSGKRASEFERFSLRDRDIVISLDRPLIATGLKVARITKEDLPSLLLQRVGRAQIKDDSLLPDFFFLWLNSPLFVDAIDPGRSNGVPHISSREIESLPLMLPPLTEQKRIVAKVDELMALCDDLEARLTQAQDDGKRLVEAAVRALLAA